MVLLSKDSPNSVVLDCFETWNNTFTTSFCDRMGVHGWTSYSVEDTAKRRSTTFITCPPFHWYIVQKHGGNYMYDPTMVNPFYQIYYKHRLVGTIKVEVYGWNTEYTFIVFEDRLAIIDAALPMLCNIVAVELPRALVEDFLVGDSFHNGLKTLVDKRKGVVHE
jgi:hypothetical protein